jgi:hypothetical protein
LALMQFAPHLCITISLGAVHGAFTLSLTDLTSDLR